MNQTVTVQHDSGGNPGGYCMNNSTGVACPIGLDLGAGQQGATR